MNAAIAKNAMATRSTVTLETITKKPSTLTYILVAVAAILAIVTFVYIVYVATKAYEMNFQPIVSYEGDKKVYDI
jgi:cell division protein FtsL